MKSKLSKTLDKIQQSAYSVELPRKFHQESYSAWNLEEIMSRLELQYPRKFDKPKAKNETLLAVIISILNGMYETAVRIDTNSILRLNKKLFIATLQQQTIAAYQKIVDTPLIIHPDIKLLIQFVVIWEESHNKLILNMLEKTYDLRYCTAIEAKSHREIEQISEYELDNLKHLTDVELQLFTTSEYSISRQSIDMFIDIYWFFWAKVDLVSITQIADPHLLKARNTCWNISQKYSIDVSQILHSQTQQLLFPQFSLQQQ
jgi:hypothetical protein